MKRIVDIHGDIICEPLGYWDCLRSGGEMLAKMESEGVDRSDMYVVLDNLAFELRFQLTMLKKRQYTKPDANNTIPFGSASVKDRCKVPMNKTIKVNVKDDSDG